MSAKEHKAKKHGGLGDAQTDDATASQYTSLKGLFSKELIPMMYGFGDDSNPMPETVDLVEDIVIEYTSGVLQKSLDIASKRGKLKAGGKPTGPPTTDDILSVVSKDPKKALRVKELLIMQQEIKLTTEKLEKDEEALAKLME